MHNSTTVCEEYTTHTDTIKIGDTLSVIRRWNGDLHFFINDTDLGLAAKAIPENIYGIVDLYGQTSMATIVQNCPEKLPVMSWFLSRKNFLTFGEDTDLSKLHSKNVQITDMTVHRKNSNTSYDSAVCIFDFPLSNDGDYIEFVVDAVVPVWTGSVEIGGLLQSAESLFNIHDSSLMQQTQNLCFAWTGNIFNDKGKIQEIDYSTVNFEQGTTVKITRSGNSLTFCINDICIKSIRAPDEPFKVAVNLYGKCSQITVYDFNTMSSRSKNSSETMFDYDPIISDDSIYDMEYIISEDQQNRLIFAPRPLIKGNTSQVQIKERSDDNFGSLSVGVITLKQGIDFDPNMEFYLFNENCVIEAENLKSYMVISHDVVNKNGNVIENCITTGLDRLLVGDSVCLDHENNDLIFSLNGMEIQRWHFEVDATMYAFFAVRGKLYSVINLREEKNSKMVNPIKNLKDKNNVKYKFSNRVIGENIKLENEQTTASRVNSYLGGFLSVVPRLIPETSVEFMIKHKDTKWRSGLVIGVTESNETTDYKNTNSIYISETSVFKSGLKTKDSYCRNLNTLEVGQTVGIAHKNGGIHLIIDGISSDKACEWNCSKCFVFIDLYGNSDGIDIKTGKCFALLVLVAFS